MYVNICLYPWMSLYVRVSLYVSLCVSVLTCVSLSAYRDVCFMYLRSTHQRLVFHEYPEHNHDVLDPVSWSADYLMYGWISTN